MGRVWIKGKKMRGWWCRSLGGVDWRFGWLNWERGYWKLGVEGVRRGLEERSLRK